MAKIKLNYNNAAFYPGATFTEGFEFLNKEGKSLLKVGLFNGDTTKVFKVEESEQVIGIKAHTRSDPTFSNHGSLFNLQFKISKPN